MAFEKKTNWALNETVMPEDTNRWEQGIHDAHADLASHETDTNAHSTEFGNKQGKITASGLLKGDGSGGVSAGVSGTDYQAPTQDLTEETEIVDTDMVPMYDTSATSGKKILFSNIKGALKTFFDGVYQAASSALQLGSDSTTAHRGDHGASAYAHSLVVTGNPHDVTAEEVGATHVYKSFEDVDEDFDDTTAIATLVEAMEDNTRLTAYVDTNASDVYPVEPGFLTVDKISDDAITLRCVSADALTPKSFFGVYDSTNGFSGWTEDNVPIGDIRYTIKNTLGDNYLLCNGAFYNGATYPDLFDIDSGDATWAEHTPPAVNNRIHRVDDYYVITKNATVYYSESLDGPWLSFTAPSVTSISQVKKLNGKYIICGDYHNNPTLTPYVLYSDSFTTGYTSKAIAGNDTRVYDVEFVNGKYVALLYYGYSVTSNSYVLSSSDLNTWGGTVTFGSKSSGTEVLATSMTLSNIGEYVFVLLYSYDSTSHTGYLKLFYCAVTDDPSLSASWINHTISSLNTNALLGDFSFINNEYVFSYKKGTSLYIAHSTDPSSWSTINKGVVDTVGCPGNFVYYNSKYYVMLSGPAASPQLNKLLYGDSLDDMSDELTLGTITNVSAPQIYIDETYGMIVCLKSIIKSSFFVGGSYKQLPEISVDKSFAFIKAK